MIKSIVHYLNFILLISVFILLAFNYCGTGHKNSDHRSDTISNTVNVRYDSAKTTILKPNFYLTVQAPSTLPKGVDTSGLSEIVKSVVVQFFQQSVHVDVRRDSDLEATIQDTISQNKLTGRGFSYKILRPQSAQTTTIVKDRLRNKMYLGLAAGIPEDRLQLDISSALLLKNENILGVNYNLTSDVPLIERFRISYMQKLSFKPP